MEAGSWVNDETFCGLYGKAWFGEIKSVSILFMGKAHLGITFELNNFANGRLFVS